MYQYEVDVDGKQGGAHTAINRLINFNKKRGNKYNISFIDKLTSDYDISGLTPSQQNMLFLVDKIMDPTANMGAYDLNKDGVLSNKELAGFHADEHWAGHKGDEDLRKSFIQKLVEDYQTYKP